MKLEFPYQIVTFLGREPIPGEKVYYGPHGWYPQVALKRRFKIVEMGEEDFIQYLREYFNNIDRPDLITGELVKPGTMPVHVIDIKNQDVMKRLHLRLIKYLKNVISSRYPDRDGEHYYAHITAEYDNEFVIPVDDYVNKTFSLKNVWLLKDIDDEDSSAFVKII